MAKNGKKTAIQQEGSNQYLEDGKIPLFVNSETSENFHKIMTIANDETGKSKLIYMKTFK